MAPKRKFLPKKSIDLERSEIRYIFFSNDQDSLISDFSNIGFEELHYKETPVTQTVYFGSKLGLKPGLSIKARVYSPENIQNSWQLTRDTPFNFLEVKSTVSQEDRTQSLISGSHAEMTHNVVFRIQRVSEDGLLRDSSLKIKSRLKKSLSMPGSSISTLKFSEIVTLLTEPSELDEELSRDAKNLLDSKIRPLYHKSLKPHMMTQYSRIHLVPKPEYSDWKKFIRITIDPGVEYYALTQIGDIKDHQDTLVEFVTKEKHCRLEFKLDPLKLKEQGLNEKIADILRKYGCIACLSKKWTGLTVISERYIEKQALWREPLGKHISGFFPVDPSWFTYGSVSVVFHRLIKPSSNFSTYEEEPNILVKNQNFISGFMGVPTPNIIMTVEGPYVNYNLSSESYPVKLWKELPDFYIQEDLDHPVRSTVVSCKKELDDIIHKSVEIDKYSYFRSYGFLVVASPSNRVYKLTIERKTDVKGEETKTEVYCKLRYVGTKHGLYKVNVPDIYRELHLFYNESAPIMSQPIEKFD